MTKKLAALILGISIITVSIASTASIIDKDTRYARYYGEDSDWRPEQLTRLVNLINSPDSIRGHTVEITRYPDQRPSRSELERSWELYRESFQAARENEWFDKENGLSDGFNATLMGAHYPNPDYTGDSETLQPEKPEYLMYYSDPEMPNKSVLVGVMYRVKDLEDEGEQIGGPITRWHYHIWAQPACLKNTGPRDAIQCQNGTLSKYSREMLHVWFIDHPEGQFSSGMNIPLDLVSRGPEMLEKQEFLRKQNRTY